MKSTLLSILLGAAFAVSAHATTWTFDYTGWGDPLSQGETVTGTGEFQFNGALSTVTLFDLTSFDVGLDYNVDNCHSPGCAWSIDSHEDFTLANLQTFWFQPNNPMAIQFTSEIPSGDIFNTQPQDLGEIWATTDFNGVQGIITNLVDPPDAPEGATVWMFAIGLIFICWLTKRAKRFSI